MVTWNKDTFEFQTLEEESRYIFLCHCDRKDLLKLARRLGFSAHKITDKGELACLIISATRRTR